ncbi:MAG: histidine kinase [Gemmataceae bacterium]
MIGGREDKARRKDGTVFQVELAVGETTVSLFTGILRPDPPQELEREVVELVSQEQLRIGQDLHDSVAQELTALNLLAGRPRRCFDRPGRRGEGSWSRGWPTGCGGAKKQLRAVLRGLVPVAVDAGGLMAALLTWPTAPTGRPASPTASTARSRSPLADNVVATQVA